MRARRSSTAVATPRHRPLPIVREAQIPGREFGRSWLLPGPSARLADRSGGQRPIDRLFRCTHSCNPVARVASRVSRRRPGRCRPLIARGNRRSPLPQPARTPSPQARGRRHHQGRMPSHWRRRCRTPAHPKLPRSVNPVRHFFWLGDGPRLGYQMRGDAARRRSARIARSAKTVRAMRRIRLPNKPGKVRNVAK